MDAPVGGEIQPISTLPVEVSQVHKVQPRPEVDAQIAHARFDLALRLCPIGLAGPGREAIVVGKVEIARIPMHRAIGITVYDGRLEIIMQDFPRCAAKVVESMHMATQPPGRIDRDGELYIHGSRPSQGHHKSVQPALLAMVVDEPKTAPVHLGLLPRLGLETYCGFLSSGLAIGLHKTLDQALAALIALRVDLAPQFIAVQHPFGHTLLQIGFEGIQLAAPRLACLWCRADGGVQRGPHGLAIMPRGTGNLADGHSPAIHVLDHETLLHSQHGWPFPPSSGLPGHCAEEGAT